MNIKERRGSMKRLLLIGAIIIGSLGFSTSTLAALSQEQIKTIIKKEVPNGQLTEVEMDKENERKIYEVEVMDGSVKKEFKIDAETGEIIKFKSEQKAPKRAKKEPKISYDKAKEIALKQSKDGKFKEIELKHKNGVLVYDVEIAEGFMDREFLIDAMTGEILRDKKDF